MASSLYLLTIDLKAIDHNIKQIKGLLKPGTKIMAVVKSNAYGHGLYEVARQALRSGATHLGVVSADEALELRRRGILHPIILLAAVAKDDIPYLIKNKIAMSVYNAESYRAISRSAYILNKKAIIHLKLDSGINRLGFSSIEDLVKVAKAIQARPRYFELEGLYSHLASVEELNQSYTNDQIRAFERAVAKIEGLGIKIPLISLAASAAAIMLPNTRFNCVRIGIAMYGLWPSRGVELWCKRSKKTRGFKLKPALSFRTRLVHVKRVRAGAYVGYGSSFQAPTAMTIGVVPVGYAEGLPRALSNMGFALLKGAVVPIVGRVCMNMTLLDISRRPRARVGDEVVIVGKSKNKEITATDIADWAGTINYEIVTRIPDHLERIYK